MKTISTLALLAALAVATPVLAQTVGESAEGVAKDAGAIAKDNAAIAKARADKADAKATGDVGTQAWDSVKIGEKKAEKGADKAIYKQDKEDLKEQLNKQ